MKVYASKVNQVGVLRNHVRDTETNKEVRILCEDILDDYLRLLREEDARVKVSKKMKGTIDIATPPSGLSGMKVATRRSQLPPEFQKQPRIDPRLR